MIRRTVRARFRNVYWRRPGPLGEGPFVFAANHHGWHDGYLMFHLVTALGVPSLDWIEEFGAFPLFEKVGGMPYPPGDPAARARTVRMTIRRMRSEGRSLVLFAEAVLHRPPDVLPFGRALELVASKVPGCRVVPVAIHYDMSLHERPEAFLALGEPLPSGPDSCGRARDEVARLLEATRAGLDGPWDVLAPGTPDVNERWDVRRAPGGSRFRSGRQQPPGDGS